MNVLHLPTAVGGYSWGLAQAEKKIGIDSKVLVAENNWLKYDFDICLYDSNCNKFFKLFKRAEAFLKTRNKYDIYHFNFGSSLIDFTNYKIHLIDLPYYKGKKIMTYNGCDARQKYPTMNRVNFSACHQKDCYSGVCNSRKLDTVRQKRIKKVQEHVYHIFAVNPDLMHFLPREKTTFLPYAIAGWNDIKTTSYNINKTIKIIHAPTNKACKGTGFILQALKNLQKKYKNIEIILIENIHYKQALKLYQKAHIVIDQVLVGWYGGFGVEVMKMGKPLGVFIREEDLKFIPTDMAKDLKDAIINITPFNIEEQLSKYLDNIDLLYKKSKASLDYIHKWHTPKYVAGLTKKIYER
jgi:tetratricopeptide (TPR) repeat protein